MAWPRCQDISLDGLAAKLATRTAHGLSRRCESGYALPKSVTVRVVPVTVSAQRETVDESKVRRETVAVGGDDSRLGASRKCAECGGSECWHVRCIWVGHVAGCTLRRTKGTTMSTYELDALLDRICDDCDLRGMVRELCEVGA